MKEGILNNDLFETNYLLNNELKPNSYAHWLRISMIKKKERKKEKNIYTSSLYNTKTNKQENHIQKRKRRT